MAQTETKMCRICLITNEDNIVSDSSCYAKFFTQFLYLKNFNGKLWLCIWCKASLKRALALFTLAMETEKARQDEITTDIQNNSKSLYTLSYIHNPHIDIPPVAEEEAEIFKELMDPLHEIQIEVEIPLKSNKQSSKCNENELKDNINEETNEISNFEQESMFENEIPIRKRNKKQLNFTELKFEVEYLNLEEQLKEVEMKKVKYKDFKFQCDDCGVGFLTSDVYDAHKIRHSELAGPHKCNICHLHYKSQDILSQHMLAHKRRFKCLLCNAIFHRRWSHCVAHRYKCGGVAQPIACGECSKVFSDQHSLKIHMKVHRTERNHCCTQCDKKFSSKQRLNVHTRSHSGIKPFSCAHCNRSFSTNSNLRAHSALHEESTRYYCVECNTYYKTAKSLKRHFNESIRHVTSKTDAYSCNDCNKQFASVKALDYHIKTRHTTEYRCTQCDKIFSNSSNLNKHIKCIHTIK